MLATSAGEWVHCGRVFSATEIAELCATVAWLPGLARKELAATVCEHLGWTTLTGTGEDQRLPGFSWSVCRRPDCWYCPALRPSPPRAFARPPSASAAPVAPPFAEPAVHCALSALAPVSLAVVSRRDPGWRSGDALVARWHPLGFSRGPSVTGCATSSRRASGGWAASCCPVLPRAVGRARSVDRLDGPGPAARTWRGW
jgi:hypothetical protein